MSLKYLLEEKQSLKSNNSLSGTPFGKHFIIVEISISAEEPPYYILIVKESIEY